MNREFITYEQALQLKELGFDEPCFAFYQKEYAESTPIMVDDNHQYRLTGFRTCRNSEIPEHYVSTPLYQQAFRWFREKHNLYSEINLDSYKEPYSLKVTIKHLDDTNTFVDKEYYPYSNGIGDIDNKNYEEAELACLDKLLQIVKAAGVQE